MKTAPVPAAPPTSRNWPVQVELERAGDRHVQAADGRSFELEAFRDACGERAPELRRAAGDALASAAFAFFRELRAACARALRVDAATLFHPRQRSSS